MEFLGTLHAHSDYSNIRLRDSTNKLSKLIRTAAELGNSVIGITDHECVSNAVAIENDSEIQKVLKEYPDFKIIRGNEIYLTRNGLNADTFVKGADKYYHFILLAKDAVGHQQIRELSTRAWHRSYMARGLRRVPTYYQDLRDIIESNRGHIIGSSACLGGVVPTQLLKWRDTNDPSLYEKIILWVKQIDYIFGHGNFYLEMQPSKNKDQIFVNKELLKISELLNIPYIITTDAHYLRPEDRKIHKIYLNSQNGDREVDDFYATTYLMTTEEIESFFPYFSSEILNKAYENIKSIKDSCENYSILKPLKIPRLSWNPHPIHSKVEEWFERIPYLKTFNESEYKEDRELVKAIIYGIENHNDLFNEKAFKAIDSNLEMTWVSSNVNKARWSAYYLNLQKIIDLCWEAGSLVGPGRGSGAGFILLYVLDIIQINPLRETTKVYPWRFLNPQRVSVLDVDFDSEGGRRKDILRKLREYYGEDRVANVATFRQEKPKMAIQSAARGLGIDVDIAASISALIPEDRGQPRSLDQCMYGDEENDWKPVKQFVIEMTENYPELWEVAKKIEGLICGYGVHAGGVIFVDEPFTNSTALLRAPDGTIATQFELHACEAVSLIKYDILSVEAMDKIHICLDLLCDYGYIKREATLKETYEKILGIYKIERDDPKMWEMVWNHKIQSLFQMEKQSGIEGISILKPTSVDDLATLNSVIRLMAQEKGGEMPVEKLGRFKANPKLWDEEMQQWGLTPDERTLLHKELDTSYGICESQEGFMMLVQLPECGGFDLTWADRLRKSIAKKNPKEFNQLTIEYFDNCDKKGLSKNLCNYVWKVLVAYSRGYGFNKSHTLSYSLIALQEMNLCFKYPIIFWNCACLISEAGGDEGINTSEDEVVEDIIEEEYDDSVEDFLEDTEDLEEGEKVSAQKKKKRAVNYGKVATAIGKFKTAGIEIASPDINNSSFTFSPDVENNKIRYGMSGITRVSKELIEEIIKNRPYSSIQDFLDRIKVTKLQMVNLIKSGAFDGLVNRAAAMKIYLQRESGAKNTLNLRNANMLIQQGLIPEELDFERRVFNFNKYLKNFKESDSYFLLDNIAMNFYEHNFDIDLLEAGISESGFKIKQSVWKKLYDGQMKNIKVFIKDNHDELLEKVNNNLIKELWDKYALGSISKWEMDSLSCYIHEHELQKINLSFYELNRWGDLPESPVVERYLPIKGKQIPIYKLQRICGTVLERDTKKKTVTLLTTDGVVIVRIYGEVFGQYDKQLSEIGADGKKHVVQKSLFSRGNKIIVTGIRRESYFLAKTYSKTPYHKVELISQVNSDGTLLIEHERPQIGG